MVLLELVGEVRGERRTDLPGITKRLSRARMKLAKGAMRVYSPATKTTERRGTAILESSSFPMHDEIDCKVSILCTDGWLLRGLQVDSEGKWTLNGGRAW